MQLPDINLIHYFLVAARTLNFAEASRELYISRQALSKNIRRIEDMMGGSLFTQEGGRLALTQMGIQFQEAAIPLMKGWDEFAWKMQNIAEANQPMLRMAVSSGTMMSLGGVFTPDFRRENPDVLLSIEEVTADHACSMVNHGTVDMAIVGSHPDYLTGFATLCINTTGIWLMMHETHPLAEKNEILPEDLKLASFITPGLHNHLHRYFMQICRQANIIPNIAAISSYTFENGLSNADPEVVYFGFPPGTIVLPDDWCVRILRVPDSEKFGTYLINRLGTPVTGAGVKMLRYLKAQYDVDGTLL